eukprot:jgi/Ulvmu1/1935/UM012_0095.1
MAVRFSEAACGSAGCGIADVPALHMAVRGGVLAACWRRGRGLMQALAGCCVLAWCPRRAAQLSRTVLYLHSRTCLHLQASTARQESQSALLSGAGSAQHAVWEVCQHASTCHHAW